MFTPLYYAYFVFGFTFAFIAVAVQFHLADTLHISPAENTYIWAIVSTPWMFKPVYGALSDKTGYRRTYISIGAFVCGVLLAYTPNTSANKVGLTAALTLVSLFMCIADVGCDSMMVEFARTDKGIQSRCWLARNIGGLAATGLSGVIYKVLGFGPILRIAAAPPLAMALYIWELPELRTVGSTVVLKKSFVAFLGMWKLLLFILVCSMVPETGNILFFKLKDRGLDPLAFSVISVAGSLTACLVAFIYQFCTNSIQAVQLSLCLGVGSATCALLITLGGNAFQLAILRSVLDGAGGMLMLLPIVIYTAKKCPEGAEGTTYSMVMAWLNFTTIVSETIEGRVILGMGITENDLSRLAIFFAGGVALSTIPFCFVSLLDIGNKRTI